MSYVSFRVTKTDKALIRHIVKRAMRHAKEAGIAYDPQDCAMDITACHANGTKLDLIELLGATDFNFIHDVFGIRQHLSRRTGKLKHCFVPRYMALTRRDKRVLNRVRQLRAAGKIA